MMLLALFGVTAALSLVQHSNRGGYVVSAAFSCTVAFVWGYKYTEGTGLTAQDFGLALIDRGTLTLSKAIRNLSRNGRTFALVGTVTPNEVLEYQLVFYNPSSRAISNVTFNDTILLFTEIEQNLYGADGKASLSCPDGKVQAVDVGAVHYLDLRALELWDAKQLLPGEEGEMLFRCGYSDRIVYAREAHFGVDLGTDRSTTAQPTRRIRRKGVLSCTKNSLSSLVIKVRKIYIFELINLS